MTLALLINTSFTDGSKTFDDKVTVTFSDEVRNSGDDWGWYARSSASLLTVAGTNGYTITSCKFYTEVDGDAITGYTIAGESPSVYLSDKNVYTDANQSVFIGAKGVTKIEVYGTAPNADPAIKVTTNAAEEGATFTEASFAMPAFDATAEYELVRDMGYKVAFSGVPTRARLAKDGDGKFHNKETLVPLADFLADAHLGNYAICAVASTGEYDGSFSSGRIELFQGYEVTVPAGEFITYYKDEPLRIEDQEAELYTIESVSGDQAVLSDRSDAMPSNTPMLVYNKSNETKVILLIPCNEPDLAITVAPEFQGTLTGTTIAASTEGQTNYAFNGKAFVFVKNAIEVGPNKAWLSVNTGVPSARITLVFDEATGVGSIENGKLTIDNWYDLNGRKLQGMPTKKGVYILNGKKVVVK